MSQTFGDLELAAKTKEVLSTLVRKEVEKLRPAPRYATVASLDPVMVNYPGDPQSVPVRTGSVVPSAVGQIVRIEGPPGDRYIADVVGVQNGSVPPYSPGGGSNNFPQGIVIGNTPITMLPPNPVTGLTVLQGLEFENIYFILEWSISEGAAAYEVEVAEKLGANTYDLEQMVMVSGPLARINNLRPFTEYGIRIRPINPLGVRGAPTVWHDHITIGDNTIPPQVSIPVLSRGATTLVVSFPPLNYLDAPDVARGNGLYEVQIDTANTFNTSNLRTSLGTGSVVAFSDLTFQATWFARVRAIDTSGNLGAWSNVASLVAGAITSTQILDGAITETKIGPNSVTSGKIAANTIEATHIAAGQISSDKIAVAGLDAAVIKFGTMSGDRITASTIDVNRLKTSTLTATTITLGTNGAFRIGNPTTNGIFINDQGIRAYAGGNTTFHIDANGNASYAGSLSAGVSISSPTIVGGSIQAATFTGGTFQTDIVGSRVLISGTNNKERVTFFNTNGAEIGHVGFKSTGYGSGLHLASSTASGVSVVGPSGAIWDGAFNAYVINCNTINNETLHVFNGLNSSGYLRRGGWDVITTQTIGSQSVSYASSANYASSAGSANQAGAMVGTAWYYSSGSCFWSNGSGIHRMTLSQAGALSVVSLTASSKSFEIDHPAKPGWRLRYASLEGPALDVIHRGRVELVDGEADVDIDEAAGLFPGTWKALTDSDSWQVMLYNETGDKNPHCEWIDGVLHISCEDDSASVAWMAIGTRKDLEPNTGFVDYQSKLITQVPTTGSEVS